MRSPGKEVGFKTLPLSSSSITASTAYHRFPAKIVAYVLEYGNPVYSANQ